MLWQCPHGVRWAHGKRREGGDRGQRKRTVREENPGEGTAFVVKGSPSWGCLREAEGPRAEVGAHTNDAC